MVFRIMKAHYFFRWLIVVLFCQAFSWSALARPSTDDVSHKTAKDHHTDASAKQPSVPMRQSPYRASRSPAQASNFYQAMWGIDDLHVQRTASNNLIRFSYRITDAARAKVLGDKHATPHLIDFKRGFMLEVPVMEKVGPLRQTGNLLNGLTYWMVFSNKGGVVKAGDRVDVVIGTFHADSLVVE